MVVVGDVMMVFMGQWWWFGGDFVVMGWWFGGLLVISCQGVFLLMVFGVIANCGGGRLWWWQELDRDN